MAKIKFGQKSTYLFQHINNYHRTKKKYSEETVGNLTEEPNKHIIPKNIN